VRYGLAHLCTKPPRDTSAAPSGIRPERPQRDPHHWGGVRETEGPSERLTHAQSQALALDHDSRSRSRGPEPRRADPSPSLVNQRIARYSAGLPGQIRGR
jgi:hypothetical protein